MKTANNRHIHVNSHRIQHTAKETYMLTVTEESSQQMKYTCANGHRRKQPTTETYTLMVTEEST